MISTPGASIHGIITLKIMTFGVSKLSIKALAFTTLNMMTISIMMLIRWALFMLIVAI